MVRCGLTGKLHKDGDHTYKEFPEKAAKNQILR